MNFFEQQDRARRSTHWLIVLFVLAVLGIITAVNVAAFGIATVTGQYAGWRARATITDPDRYWRGHREVAAPPTALFVAVTGATIVVILGGSVFKIAMLSRGGRAVAQMMNARQLLPNTRDEKEKQLLNVVEEMAIASGLSVPGVFVLDDERAINAFAAGFTPSDYVVTVTRGTLDVLTRDELQGVIGHEFSHLLNGDTRLNIRLIGVLHGILVIGLIGYYLVRSLRYVRSGGKDKAGGVIVMLLLGVSLLVIGYAGMFFANLIQAAVCRSREFLADASSVQFTRNPAGIAGALKKIGGIESRDNDATTLEDADAVQIAHMFFARGIHLSLTHLLSTHPPIADRIRAIEPTWDGRFISIPMPAAAQSDYQIASAFAAPRAVPVSLRAEQVVHRVGRPTPLHVEYAAGLISEIPSDIAAEAREPFGARAVILSLLLSSDSQLDLLTALVDAPTLSAARELAPRIRSLGDRARLPLLDLATPALHQLSLPQCQHFTQALTKLIYADQQVTLSEFVLYKIVSRHLTRGARPPVVEYVAIAPVMDQIALLLSALATAGSGETQAAYECGMAQLANGPGPVIIANVDLKSLDTALNRLRTCSPGVKRRIIDAAAQCVACDGVVEVREAELLRAVAATLDCPLPPLVSPPAPPASQTSAA
jgi:Zn-dependent protease with chaperone function